MKPMLAGKYDPKKIAKLLPMYGQVKLDGIRVFIKDGIAWTRSLKPVPSQQVQSFVAYNKLFLEGLDGELVCGDPTAPDCYQRSMSSIMSRNKPDDDLHFYVFDQWDSVRNFQGRLEDLQQLDFSGLSRGGLHRVSLLTTDLLWTIEDIESYCEKRILEGHEGIILRHPEAYYKQGRGTPTSGELIKMKDGRWLDTEARVVEVNELFSNQNEATINELGYTERSGHQENLVPMGILGSVTATGFFPEDDQLPMHLWGRQYEVRIGTGFDSAQREALWKDSTVVGQIVKFKFFTGGVKDKPRFPTFLGFRHPDDMDFKQLSLL